MARIFGMAHAEIRRKFDEIVAFAEIDRFLDTRSSAHSGMYVRLTAVAAHLEPEILVVDEVLAVDAEFQKKCLGKMDEVMTNGRVLFVSHNMVAIEKLCPRSHFWWSVVGWRLTVVHPETVDLYLAAGDKPTGQDLSSAGQRHEHGE